MCVYIFIYRLDLKRILKSSVYGINDFCIYFYIFWVTTVILFMLFYLLTFFYYMEGHTIAVFLMHLTLLPVKLMQNWSNLSVTNCIVKLKQWVMQGMVQRRNKSLFVFLMCLHFYKREFLKHNISFLFPFGHYYGKSKLVAS